MNSNRFLRFAIFCAVVWALLLSVTECKGGRGGGGGAGRSGSWGRSHGFGSGIYMMPTWHGHNSFNTYADSKSQETSDNGNDNDNNNNNTPNSYAKEPPTFAPLFDLEEMRDSILRLHRANQMVAQQQKNTPQLTEEQLAEQEKSMLQMNAMLNSFLDKGRETLRELDAHFQRN